MADRMRASDAEREEIVFDLHERGEQTLVSVSGRAPPAIRRALSELER